MKREIKAKKDSKTAPTFLVGDDTGLIKRVAVDWKFNTRVRKLIDEEAVGKRRRMEKKEQTEEDQE